MKLWRRYDYHKTLQRLIRELGDLTDKKAIYDFLKTEVTRLFGAALATDFLKRLKDPGRLQAPGWLKSTGFSPRDQQLLETLGYQVQCRLNSVTLLKERQHRNTQLRAVNRFIQTIHATFDPSVWDSETQAVMAAVTAEPGSLQLVDVVNKEVAHAKKNAEMYHQMMRLKAFHKTILETLPTPVLAVNPWFRITEMNAKAEQLFEVRREEVLDRPLTVLQHRPLMTFLEQVQDMGVGPLYRELTIAGRQVGVMVDLLDDGTYNAFGVMAVMTDLEKIHDLQRQAAYTDRLFSLGTMAAGIAHDIKNPLTSLKLLAEMVPEHWDNEGFKARFETLVPSQIEHIVVLCRSLQRLGESREPQLVCCRLSDVVTEAAELLETQTVLCGANLLLDIEDPSLCVMADPHQLQQVVVNLVLNALQAVSPNQGRIALGVVSRGGEVMLSVQDNGMGMAKPVLKRMFDPFFTTKEAGTGLGLTMVYTIVNAHQGRIEVASEPGQGTRFEIFLKKP